jgi:S1-C subfamily serine protease
MNGNINGRYSVLKMVHHPGYTKDSISPDVALMRINGQVRETVRLATAAELSQIAPGVPIFLYGFPGRLNKEDAPEATFTKGDIGRVTTFAQRLGDFGQNTLLQHSAFSAAGTSGSPIFNSAGLAIGINAGGYLEDGEKLAGYNFAMRIDLLDSLFPLMGTK